MPAIQASHSLRSIFFATTFVAGTTLAANNIQAQPPGLVPEPIVHDHQAHVHLNAVVSDPLWAGYKSGATAACGCKNCEKKQKPRVKGRVKKVLNTFSRGIDILIFGTGESSACDTGCESNCDDACPDLQDESCDAVHDGACDSMGPAAHQHPHHHSHLHQHAQPKPMISPRMMPTPTPVTGTPKGYPTLPEMRSAQPLPSNAPRMREIESAPKDPFADDPISNKQPRVRRTALPGTR